MALFDTLPQVPFNPFKPGMRINAVSLNDPKPDTKDLIKQYIQAVGGIRRGADSSNQPLFPGRMGELLPSSGQPDPIKALTDLNVQAAEQAPSKADYELLKVLSQKSALQNLLQRFPNAPTEEEFTPTPIPVRRQEAIPERGPETPNRFGRIAAALSSLLVPGSAGQFGSAELQGEEAGREQRYGDALTRYRLATARDEQEYNDALRQHEETTRAGIENRNVRFRNQQAAYNALLNRLDREFQLGSLTGEAAGLPELAGRERTASVLRERAGGEEARIKQQQEQEKLQAEEERAKIQGLAGLLNRDVTGRYGLLRGLNASDAAYLREIIRDSVNAAGKGFNFAPPTAPGLPPTITPKTQGELSLPQRATVEQKNAQTARYRQMVANIRAGKSIDTTKATPAQRLALQKLTGARQAYESAKRSRLDFIKKNGAVETDRTYIALTRAAEQAAKDYQDADREAHDLMGGGSAPRPTVPTVRNDADYNDLPSGTVFIDPQGKRRRKP